MDTVYLMAIGFGCAWCTGAIGAGGGILLLALLQGAVPVHAMNQVHGLVQLVGNLHRLAICFREVQWRLIARFAVPCLLGSMVSASVPLMLSEDLLLVVLGSGIVAQTVVGDRWGGMRGTRSLVLAGAIQGLASPIMGGVGGVTSAALLGQGLTHSSRASHIAATGLIVNASKTAVFIRWGFAFSNYLPSIAVLILASFVGTWAGIRYSKRMDERAGTLAVKTVILLSGMKLIASGLGVL
jgi:uncharacterized membrane protein YfcA